MWPFIILYVLIRNQLVLKPIAWGALRATRRMVESLGYRPKSTYMNLGLAEPEALVAHVIFATDAELISFGAGNHEESVVATFRQRLAQSLYPKAAVSKTRVDFYSHEAIMRGGGYYLYFK